MSLPNYNIGILGHVDSGKTTLTKSLSEVASTACFDKNPQSKARGITLDLGFSSFKMPFPGHLGSSHEELLVTLVDCPGHASLLKTVIGGAHIIDMMILVVDIMKGIQTQTAECLIIGELTCNNLLVVLNKVDLIPEAKRDSQIAKVTKKISMTLSKTKFKDCKVISCSAGSNIGITELVSVISNNVQLRTRDTAGDFVFAVDHCFGIRGQGTIFTGTCLSGSISINGTIKIADTKQERKVKSMQVFHKSVEKVSAGDRAGICVTQFDAKLLERGLVYTGDAIQMVHALIIDLHKVPYYKGSVTSKTKYHISVGHETVLGRLTFFSAPSKEEGGEFSFENRYQFEESFPEEKDNSGVFALLELENVVQCVPGSMVIISRLDMDINSPTCRLAFWGRIQHSITSPTYISDDSLSALKVYKTKEREGIAERMNDEYTVIVKDLFKKETDIDLFTHLRVQLSTGESGVIEGSFGNSGKCKVNVPEGLGDAAKDLLDKKKKKDTAGGERVTVKLTFKRFLFDKKKQMLQ